MGNLGGVGVAICVAAGMVALTACGPPRVVVSGRITQSPGCGWVEPDKPVCPDLPVAGEVQFITPAGTIVTHLPTRPDGVYAVLIRPGPYTLHIDTRPGPWPQCPDTPVEVKNGIGAHEIDLVCGSGQR